MPTTTPPHPHLAQFNIARAVAPLDDPKMQPFVAQLDAVNTIADASPGFVWRLKAAPDDPIQYVRSENDPLLLVNLTVWSSIKALHDFTYHSSHAGVFRDRYQWFERHDGPTFCLWWIPPGERPTVADGFRRLALLASVGPSYDAFTFRRIFSVDPGQAAGVSAR